MIIPSVSNGGKADSYVSMLGRVAGNPGRPRYLEVAIEVPRRTPAMQGERLLCELAAIMGAWSGQCSDDALALLVVSQFDPLDLPGRPARVYTPKAGLPKLRVPIDSAVRPYVLGWMNYWSNEAAALAGLGDPADCGDVAELRREGSGWFMRLTNERFDVANEEHLERLRAAYQRFPGVGRIPKQ